MKARDYILKHKDKTARELAAKLNLSKEGVHYRAKILGIVLPRDKEKEVKDMLATRRKNSRPKLSNKKLTDQQKDDAYAALTLIVESMSADEKAAFARKFIKQKENARNDFH